VVAATALPEGRGAVALLIVAIATTAFDGAKEGPVFSDAAPSLQDFFVGLGAGKGLALEAAFLVGYAAIILLVTAVWWIAVEGMPRIRSGLTRRGLADGFAHSLIPIVAAYVVAHYFSLVAFNGQDAYRLASDPLGDGSDLFGTATRTIDYGVVSATGIWYVQVVALVLGHVIALVLGHDRALALYGSAAPRPGHKSSC
jgi:hypothetical protein